jgi:PAS domain S-box-containing protein
MSARHDDDLEQLRSTVVVPVEADPRSAALRNMVAQLVIDTTSEGIWLIDAQARTTFVNHAAAQLLGYSEEEMIGRHIFDFMDEERRPIAQQNLLQRQRGKEDRQAVELRRKDGTFIWVIGSANPVYDRYGRYAGALALLGDLTAQKELEDRLRAENAALEEKLRQATARSADASATSGPATSLLREGLRALTACAAGGAFVTAVGILSAAGIVGALLGDGDDRQSFEYR